MIGGAREHKRFLHADDIFLLIREPATSISLALNTIDMFSQISAYKINWQKSETLPVSKFCPPVAITSLQFKWIPSGMKYLGVKLSNELLNIMQSNMMSRLQKTKNNLDKWRLLNLTLWAKINTVTIVVSPTFYYVSMMLPVIISPLLFKHYNQMIKDYLWDGKNPRINVNRLYIPRDEGGLALPNVELYNI